MIFNLFNMREKDIRKIVSGAIIILFCAVFGSFFAPKRDLA